jgi:hypothetical protein
MSPDINVMRQYIGELYSGRRWKRRVTQMSDAQVMAIYFKARAKEEEAKNQKDGADDIPF